MVDHSIAQSESIETAAVKTIIFGQNLLSSTNNDHQYFNNVFVSPALFSSNSSSSETNNNNECFDFESLLQQQQPSQNLLFSSSSSPNDTADVQQYFNDTSIATLNSGIIKTEILVNSNSSSLVPTSPSQLNFDTDFPQLGDDILEQALRSLGDLTKSFNDETLPIVSNFSASFDDGQQIATTSGFDFLQQDDYTDLAWEESFAQLFPSLSNA